MRVKLCGLRLVDEVHLAAELGAWACGFVFHPPSPRHVSSERAALLSREAAGLQRVGVFVHQEVDEILRVADRVGLDAAQLHRDWRPQEVARLHRAGLQVLVLTRPERLGQGPAGRSRGEETPDFWLLEPAVGGPGGTGIARDWIALRERLAAVVRPGPFLLAGGLTPENVATAVQALEPDGVDVSSGIEGRRGVKDLERMRRFMERVGEIDAAHCR